MRPLDAAGGSAAGEPWFYGAGYYLETEVVSLPDSVWRKIANWCVAAVAALAEGGDLPLGPRQQIFVRERSSGRIVMERNLGRDPGGAFEARRMIEDDLRRLDLEAFLREYEIDWRPE